MEKTLERMKTLKFRQHLVKEILAGRKNVTWRLFDDKNLKNDDYLVLINWNTKEKFAEAEIVNITEKKLKDLKKEDTEGHELFQNREEMMATYKEYYGERVDGETVVKIIKFKLLRTSRYLEVE